MNQIHKLFRILAMLYLGSYIQLMWAENWSLLGENSKFKQFIDIDSIRTEAGFVRSWDKSEYYSVQMHSFGKSFVQTKGSSAVDCQARSVATATIVFYDAQGGVVSSSSWPRNEWSFIEPPPGTIGETQINFVCEWAKTKTQAENWSQIGETSGFTYFIDRANIRTVDGFVRFWDKWEYFSPQTDSLGKSFVQTKSSSAVDCQARTSALTGWLKYDAQGGVVSSDLWSPTESKFKKSPPGSAGYNEINFVCDLVNGKQPQANVPAPPVSAEASPVRAQSGSGFTVDKQGTVVTNQHVIEGCTKFEVRLAGVKYPAQLLKADKNLDLALLRVKTALPASTIRRDPVAVGQMVFVAGYPLAGVLGSEMNFTQGMVSNLAGIGSDITNLQITAPVQPGNSGGPLVDDAGQVMGVVVGKLDALEVAKRIGDIPQNVNFAIKGDMLRLFLDASQVHYETTAGPSRESVQVANRVRAFTVQVVCERQVGDPPGQHGVYTEITTEKTRQARDPNNIVFCDLDGTYYHMDGGCPLWNDKRSVTNKIGSWRMPLWDAQQNNLKPCPKCVEPYLK